MGPDLHNIMEFVHTLGSMVSNMTEGPEGPQGPQHHHHSADSLINTTVVVAALATYIFTHFASAVSKVYNTVQEYAMRRVFSTCTIYDTSDVYTDAEQYIRGKLTTTRIRILDTSMVWSQHRAGDEDEDEDVDQDDSGPDPNPNAADKTGSMPKLTFEHNDDGSWYTFCDAGHRFWVCTHSMTNKHRASNTSSIMTISTLGSSVQPILDLLKRAQVARKATRDANVLVRFDNNYTRRVPTRSWDTIFLPDAVKTRLRDDLKWFLASKAYYRTRGVPYRRGYCLYGPPGTGKTSACIAMASEAGLALKVINISSCSVEDFQAEILTMPSKTLLLLEDVDTALPVGPGGPGGPSLGAAPVTDSRSEGGDDASSEDGSHVDLAGEGAPTHGPRRARLPLTVILNTLDGVASPDGLLFIMTTNHMEHIPESLARRCAVTLFVDNPVGPEIRNMFMHMFPEACAQDATLPARFCEGVEQLGTRQSMCRLQNHCMRFRSAQDALVNLPALEEAVECAQA
jgi:hypothetical protein